MFLDISNYTGICLLHRRGQSWPLHELLTSTHTSSVISAPLGCLVLFYQSPELWKEEPNNEVLENFSVGLVLLRRG